MIEGYPSARATRRLVEELLKIQELYPAEVTFFLFRRVRQKFQKSGLRVELFNLQQLNYWLDKKFPLEHLIVKQALDELVEQKMLAGNLEGRLRLKK